jgi:hypothetical protein
MILVIVYHLDERESYVIQLVDEHVPNSPTQNPRSMICAMRNAACLQRSLHAAAVKESSMFERGGISNAFDWSL